MNAVIMSFDPNEKQSAICERKLMKRMSVKSARKAQDNLHKACKERQKFVSDLCIGRNKQCAWKA